MLLQSNSQEWSTGRQSWLGGNVSDARQNSNSEIGDILTVMYKKPNYAPSLHVDAEA